MPLLIIGVFMLISSRKETWRALSVLGIVEGLFVILLPTVLIGICMKNTMTCRQEMEPTLYAAGGLTIVASLAALIINELRGTGGSQRGSHGLAEAEEHLDEVQAPRCFSRFAGYREAPSAAG